MFKSAEARYALRAVLVGVAAAVSLVQTDADWKHVIASGVLAALAYAGVGAAVPSVEPFVGNKMEPAPQPPAGDAPGQ